MTILAATALIACSDPGGGPTDRAPTGVEGVDLGTDVDLRSVVVLPGGAAVVSGPDLLARLDADGAIEDLAADLPQGAARYIGPVAAHDGRPVALLLADTWQVWRWDGAWAPLAALSNCIGPASDLDLQVLDDGATFAACAYYDGMARVRIDGTEASHGWGARSLFAANRVVARGWDDVAAIWSYDGELRRFHGGDFADAAAWDTEPIVPEGDEREVQDLAWVGDELLGVGDGGLVVREDGDDWALEEAVDATLRSVWGTPEDGTFAVGDGGTILFDDGSGWRALDSPTTEDLHAVHGLPGGEILVVGDAGTALRVVR